MRLSNLPEVSDLGGLVPEPLLLFVTTPCFLSAEASVIVISLLVFILRLSLLWFLFSFNGCHIKIKCLFYKAKTFRGHISPGRLLILKALILGRVSLRPAVHSRTAQRWWVTGRWALVGRLWQSCCEVGTAAQPIVAQSLGEVPFLSVLIQRHRPSFLPVLRSMSQPFLQVDGPLTSLWDHVVLFELERHITVIFVSSVLKRPQNESLII